MQSFKKEALLILGAFSTIYIIAYSPLLVNSTPFADDVIRQYWGQNNNIRVGRPLIELLADVVHWFGFVTDLRPTSQLVAILLLSVCSYVLVENLAVKSASNLQKVLAGCLVGLPPFFLGNMAYSFDAPFMALSLLLSTLAAVSVGKITLSRGALSFFLLCCSLCLYQPAIAAYIAIVCFYGIHRIEEPSKAFLYCVKCAAILALALVIYLICFKAFMAGDKHDYSTVHSAMVVDASGVHDFTVRVAKFLRGKYLAGWIKYPIFMIFIMTVAAAMRRRGFAPKLMTICLIALMFISPFLIQIALQNSVLELRSVYAFGVVMALAVLCMRRLCPIDFGFALEVLRFRSFDE